MAQDEGQKTIHYLGNPKLKRSNVNLEFTKDQILEYQKCSQDPLYFIENYVKIVNIDEGLIPFKMYDYQRNMIETFDNNRYVVCKLPRQSGKTTTVGSYVLWMILFNELQSVAILANKGALAREILERLKNSYENLPFWLQQGVVEWNKGSIELENGSRIVAASTSSSAVRGSSFTHLILDEFAFVPSNIAEDFMRSVYPTISSGKKSKVFIVSTPAGMNHFYKMWMDAIEQRSNYIPIEIHWNDVPGRDLKWKEEQIKNIGEKSWKQEFEGHFLGSSDTLIDGAKLSVLRYSEPLFEKSNVKVYEKPEKDRNYVITVDTARGLGQDYSTFVVVDVTQTPYKVVAVFRDNNIQPVYFPTIIRNTAIYYNQAYVLVEINDLGIQVAESLFHSLEYENLVQIAYMGRAGQKISAGFGKSNQVGLRMTQPVKKLGCSNLKLYIEQDKLIVNDFNIIEELTTFVARKQSYEADEGKNDDLVMALVVFSWMVDQEYFKELHNIDIRKQLQKELALKKKKEQEQEEEDEMDLFFGYIDVAGDYEETFQDAEGDVWKYKRDIWNI